MHGGFYVGGPIENQSEYDLTWDRDLWWFAKQKQASEDGLAAPDYNEVFIGHTTTSREAPSLHPVHASNVWNLDQGAGWEGKLTLMDVHTHEYWQSDIVSELYPNHQGR